MSYIDVISKIKKGNLSPVYLLFGTESFLIEDTIHRLVEVGLSEHEREFNLSKYEMTEYPVEVAVEEAYTFPFMGGRRVVILKEAYFLSNAKVQSKVEHNLKKLEEYIENPAPETIFIIHAPYEKLDERKKLSKLLKKKAEVLDGSPLDDKLLYQWVNERAKEQGVAIESAAVDQLIALTSAELMLMATELKKLAIHVGEEGAITKEVVDELVARSLEQNIFALVDGVVKRKVDVSWKIYQDLLKQKEDPIKIVSLMVRQFRILYQVKQMSQQGYSQKQIASQLKLHPYVVKLAAQQTNHFKDEELLSLLDQLANIDYEIKTGKIDKTLAVELFISKRSAS
ncbi:DNA polymerase III subunit delta [Bacillus shivajii]|uniref:DNA polymerase III subunit delta n=1 Tax=Bacillus shivajii TaxID=1983719 RepID=UPI001CFC1ACC|nr:DNA polymerase III subunit delta [Bacillus shivajii]UCZ54477.1 DNA polymerase III subunit delta [Bacillus shivajii]